MLFYFTRFHEWMCKSLPTTIATYFSIEMVKMIFYWSNNNSFLTAQSTLGCIHQLLSGRLKANRPPKTTQHKDAKKNQNYFGKNVRKPKSVGQECGDLSFKKFECPCPPNNHLFHTQIVACATHRRLTEDRTSAWCLLNLVSRA